MLSTEEVAGGKFFEERILHMGRLGPLLKKCGIAYWINFFKLSSLNCCEFSSS
jgi:hypothetical protein